MRNARLAALITCLFFTAFQCANAGGIQIGRTRLIYEADKKEVALPLLNKDSTLPWLVQSWTDTGDGKTRGPFIITPPLFRLDPQKEQSLRISWSGGEVPEDRESLFFLDVRTIPATPADEVDKNVLKLIFKTRLKLFYRPHGLPGTPLQACENLRFQREGNTLLISNQSAFYSVFDSLNLGHTPLNKADLVAPKSEVRLTLPSSGAGHQVSWRCITDYGNASAKFDATLN